MNVKTVKINLMNPSIINIREQIVNKYFDYIDIESCVNQDMINSSDNKIHLTLLNELDPPIDESTMYYILKVQNRILYKQLRSNTRLITPKVILDINNNKNNKELIINLNTSNLYKILSEYHYKLKEYSNTDEESDNKQFYSYVTLIYLKLDTSDNIIQNIITEFIDKIFNYFEVQGFLLVSENKESKLIKID